MAKHPGSHGGAGTIGAFGGRPRPGGKVGATHKHIPTRAGNKGGTQSNKGMGSPKKTAIGKA